MNAHDDRDFDLLAGEYVLGTLNSEERADVERRRRNEPGLERSIKAWEARLAPLLEDVQPIAPSRDIYEKILGRLGDQPRAGSGASEPVAGPSAPSLSAAPAIGLRPGQDPRGTGGASALGDILRLRRKVRAWRIAALAATLALAALIGTLAYRPGLLLPQEERFVAVFQDGDQQPRFLLSVDLTSRQLTIRPVAAEPAPGQSYQLWIVAEALGSQPRSLGLLDGVEKPTRKSVGEIAPDVLESALFGISLEPDGGSPTGLPTGPALHGVLIPTTTEEPR